MRPSSEKRPPSSPGSKLMTWRFLQSQLLEASIRPEIKHQLRRSSEKEDASDLEGRRVEVPLILDPADNLLPNKLNVIVMALGII